MRLLLRNLVVLKIDSDEHITGMNKLALYNVYFLDLPIDPGTHRHHVAIHLRIVRVFIAECIPGEVAGGDSDHDRS